MNDVFLHKLFGLFSPDRIRRNKLRIMTTNFSIGHFEELPDEILLDLFENYIRLIDLYIAFSSLNHQRINRILNSSRISIDIPSKDIYHHRSFAHFAQQIISLRLRSFCNDIDPSKFVNLRYLHMEKPTRPQLLSIQGEYLPNLSHLSLLPCWYTYEELPRHLTHPFRSCSFEYLRICYFPNGKIVRFQSN